MWQVEGFCISYFAAFNLSRNIFLVASIGSMFRIFHLAWLTCRTTLKNICCGLKKVVPKSRARVYFWATNFGFVARFSSNSQLVAQQIWLCPSKSTNQRAAFLQPATNVFVAGQVDHARWKTGNTDQNLQLNNVARQVEGFCISYFAAFNVNKPSHRNMINIRTIPNILYLFVYFWYAFWNLIVGEQDEIFLWNASQNLSFIYHHSK